VSLQRWATRHIVERRRSFAGRGDLVPVEVDVQGKHGTYRSIRYKKPEEAKRLKEQGLARDPSPEALRETEERVRAVEQVINLEKGTGFSYRPVGENRPTAGFVVSREPEDGVGHVIDMDDVSEASMRDTIKGWVEEHMDFVEGAQNRYFGGWVETVDGRPHLFLDISENVRDRAEAERLGRERNQYGVWDVTAKEVIPTGGDGKPRPDRPPKPKGWWRDNSGG
jgi:hypothetical protein